MPATLNLRLIPASALDEPRAFATGRTDLAGDDAQGFTDLLQTRVDSSLAGGEILPEYGNALPLQSLLGPAVPLELPLTVGASRGPETLSTPVSLDLQEPSPPEPALLVPPVTLPHPENIATPIGAELVLNQNIASPDSKVKARFANLEALSRLASRDGLTPTTVSRATVSRGADGANTGAVSQLNALRATSNQVSLRAGDQLMQSATRAGTSVDAVPQELVSRSRNTLTQFTPTSAAVTPIAEQGHIVQQRMGDVTMPLSVVEQMSPGDRQPELHTRLVQNSQPVQHFAITTQMTTQSTIPLLSEQAGQVITTPVQDSAWGTQLSERVLTMAGGQQRTAEIRLVPAELGPLRVQVSIDDGAANVTFHVLHSATREAIEQALPRLREMLAESGLSLGQADVAEQGVAEGKREQDSDSAASPAPAEKSDRELSDDEASIRHRVVSSNGLVDTFA